MLVIKRDNTEVPFERNKIVIAIEKAMKNGSGIYKSGTAEEIAKEIEDSFHPGDKISIYDIENMVFDKLVDKGERLTAQAYEGYKKVREFQRKNDTAVNQQVFALLKGTNTYLNDENSNKNAVLVTTQRDYMAGILSTDMTRRNLLPPDIVQAHDEGIIHFHDADYFGQAALHNCELCNLEDMLQNGTVVNNVLIEKPHRLLTAVTIATQIITAVTSSSYGGITVSLTHLAPFVRDSYNVYLKKHLKRGHTEEDATRFAKEDLKIKIKDAVQTFNYQVNSMTNTNGQSPFLSVFMYLGETDEYKDELAMLIEEFLHQRILGLKNVKGVYITQAFPKLLYVLEEDNIHKDSKYWYLTELAAKCTAKRMVPDYISEKKMLEYKGDVYPCINKTCA